MKPKLLSQQKIIKLILFVIIFQVSKKIAINLPILPVCPDRVSFLLLSQIKSKRTILFFLLIFFKDFNLAAILKLVAKESVDKLILLQIYRHPNVNYLEKWRAELCNGCKHLVVRKTNDEMI